MGITTVIGSGVMGSAMSFPASDNGHEVRLVGTMLDREIIEGCKADGVHMNLARKLPDGVKYYQLEQLDEALDHAELIIGGVSSFGVDWFMEDIIPRLPKGVPVLSVTKGMQNRADGALVPYPYLYKEKNPDGIFCAIGGPCTSYELADKDQTHVCFCGENLNVLRRLKEMLATPYYHISLSTDVTGVECAVAMKNAYALAVTLAVGLAQREGDTLHYNSQAALFGQSVAEMRKLLRLVGGGDENIVHGTADLYVTIFGGRTRKIGTLMGRGLSYTQAMEELSGVTLESIVIATRTAHAVRALAAAGKAKEADYPLLLHVDEIINHGAPVNIPWSSFETSSPQ